MQATLTIQVHILVIELRSSLPTLERVHRVRVKEAPSAPSVLLLQDLEAVDLDLRLSDEAHKLQIGVSLGGSASTVPVGRG